MRLRITSFFFTIIFCSLYSGQAQGSFPIVPYSFQQEAIDTATMEILYDFAYTSDASNKNRQTYSLKIGSKYAIGQVLHEKDTRAENQAKKLGAGMHISAKGLGGNLTYISRYEGQISVYSRYIANKTTKYTEPIDEYTWIITKDTASIHGYLCHKAIGKIGGRKYQVWFTEGVPISLGPWKIVGLPGLVLRALDSEGQYVFDCIGISNKQSLIALPKGQYTESTRNEVKQLYERIHKDPGGVLKTLFGENVTIGSKLKAIPYNPIDLE